MNRGVLLLTGLLLAACEAAEPPPVEDQSIRPARIFLVPSTGSNISHEFVGRVEAAQSVDLSFEVPGPLIKLLVREGQSTTAGQLIAALDQTDFLLAVREAQVQLKLARQDLTRKRKLLNERGISRSIVDDAQAQYDLRQVGLAQAQERLSDTEIHAPFDGQVARRFTDNYVNVTAGEPIIRLHDLNELFVVVSVPEKILATVNADQILSLNARFAFLPEQTFALTFLENSGEADAVAQTYEITFTMPTPQEWNILPGMTATVEVEIRSEQSDQQSISIPAAALVSDPNGDFFVWKFDPESGLVASQPVQVGPAQGGGIPVRSGLQSGDLIVSSGATHLQSGMKVRPLGKPHSSL